MEEREFEGFEIQLDEKWALGVGDWECVGLKKPVLYVRTGCLYSKVASFKDMDAVDLFRKFCEKLVESANKGGSQNG